MYLPSALAVAACLASASASTFGRFGQRARDPYQLEKRSESSEDFYHHHGDRRDFRFLDHKTRPYLVDHMPDVNFDIGELYSGLVPIGTNESRALYFVFQPTIGEPVDEITIYLNGGPGCSSMDSFLQETGRFLWKPGTFLPVENQYSWVNLTNMLWVDQPVGTGFSIGTPTAVSQEETAQDFIGFFKNFQELFGIRNFKIYVTGESYAGRYVPYISAAMLDANDKTYYDLGGALVYDPCIGSFVSVQEEIPTVPFVKEHANLFNFDDDFMAELESLHKKCGYEAYIEKYLTFPAKEVQPPMYFNYTSNAECDVFDMAINKALEINPCFNLYRVTDMCPIPWDVLGFPTELVDLPAGATIYFDREDVKRAMHAPEQIKWSVCSSEPVFVGGGAGPEGEGDISADPIQHVLPQVIEATNRVLVANGGYDFVIQTTGTLLSIMNTTWNGHLGFQRKPTEPFMVPLTDLQYAEVFDENGMAGLNGPQGNMGIQHYERGLMWVETAQSGHMEPQYQPRAAYRHLQWLLGRIDHL